MPIKIDNSLLAPRGSRRTPAARPTFVLSFSWQPLPVQAPLGSLPGLCDPASGANEHGSANSPIGWDAAIPEKSNEPWRASAVWGTLSAEPG